MTWWVLKAWPWLKKYWKWLLFPIGIVVFIVGYSARKRPEVLSPGSIEAAKVARKAEDDAARKLGEAKAELERKLVGIDDNKKKAIDSLTEEQLKEVEECGDDVDKVNEILSDISNQMRS